VDLELSTTTCDGLKVAADLFHDGKKPPTVVWRLSVPRPRFQQIVGRTYVRDNRRCLFHRRIAGDRALTSRSFVLLDQLESLALVR